MVAVSKLRNNFFDKLFPNTKGAISSVCKHNIYLLQNKIKRLLLLNEKAPVFKTNRSVMELLMPEVVRRLLSAVHSITRKCEVLIYRNNISLSMIQNKICKHIKNNSDEYYLTIK